MDGKGDTFPAEMLPAQFSFGGVDFKLAPAATGTPNAVVARGQIFLHTPAPITSNAGATGINIFQKRVTPRGGKKSIINKRPIPVSQNKV